MRKLFMSIATTVAILLATSLALFASEKEAKESSIYDFKVTTIDGTEFNFADLKGKKVMIVNVASACGLTPQYEQLQEIYAEYGGEDFEIVAFPANNFGEQEKGTNEEIKEFCALNFGVQFPMMAKISVKGDDMAPIYKWLTTKELNGKDNYDVTWNFQKFLINPDGSLYMVAAPRTLPDSKEIMDWIKS